MKKAITAEQAHLIDRVMNLDATQLEFVSRYADKILTGEEVNMDEVKAEWEKEQAKRRVTNGKSEE